MSPPIGIPCVVSLDQRYAIAEFNGQQWYEPATRHVVEPKAYFPITEVEQIARENIELRAILKKFQKDC